MRQDDKIDQAREGLQRFVQQLGPHDRVGLTTFDSLPREVVPIGVKSQNARTLRVMIPQLVANGATALYDATAMGWRAVDQLHDDNRINAVVLLSDGADTASHIRLGDMLTPLRARGEGEGRQIRIFTIAYGSDAEGDVLEKIATASGGNAYSGDPKTIDKVYLQISSFF
jgi:Ca-activated chloride channel family protein